jgi:hypothetical protein
MENLGKKVDAVIVKYSIAVTSQDKITESQSRYWCGINDFHFAMPGERMCH